MIVTFYSYKGGVGRSMAMANVADILARRGARVLMIDFDLEAPGLEQYFEVPQATARAHDGLINLLEAFKQAMAVGGARQADFRDIGRFIFPVYQSLPGGGRLDLMPAGRREGADLEHYATAVRSFDWQDFYFNWEGELFFEWLREELTTKGYDLVLVDSRTGVTEMGGICSYQLADQIVMLCAANRQNLRGTENVADDFLSPRVMARRHDRPLGILVVPARIEQRDPVLLEGFINDFDCTFTRYRPEHMRAMDHGARALMIPYQPEYAFEERVVTDPTYDARRADIGGAFLVLAHAITLLAPAGSRMAELTRSLETDETPTLEYDVASRFGGYDVHLTASVTIRDRLERLKHRLESTGLQVFLDPIEPVPPDEWLRRSEQVLFHSKVLLLVGCQLTTAQQEALATLLRANRGGKNRPVRLVMLNGEADGGMAQALGLEQEARALHGGLDDPGLVEELVALMPEREQHRTRYASPPPPPAPGFTPAGTVTPPAAPAAATGSTPRVSLPAAPAAPRAPPGYTSLERKRASASPTTTVAASQPFRGDEWFREETAGYYFGRERLVADLAAAIEANPRVWLLGPSGSGKTSAVLAGVFPILRAREPSRVLERVEVGSGGLPLLTAATHRMTPGHVRHVLFVDEFERIFGLPQDQRDAIIAALSRLETSRPDIAILIGAREDLIRSLEDTPLSPSWTSPSTVRVPDFTIGELRAAIERPAERAGLAFEPGLVDRILADAGLQASALRLVQKTLLLLWENRREGWLTNAGYEKIGGIGAVVGGIGDSALAGHPKEDPVLDRILSRLVTLEVGTARPGSVPEGEQPPQPGIKLRRRLSVPVAELLPAEGDNAPYHSTILQLTRAGLLVARANDAKASCLELIHESVLTRSTQLAQLLARLLAKDRDFLLWRQRLGEIISQREELKGKAVRAAREGLKSRKADLNAVERNAIGRAVREQRVRVAATVIVLAIVASMSFREYRKDQRNEAMAGVTAADELASRQQWREAIATLDAASGWYPHRDSLRLRRARAHAGLGENALAIQDYTLALTSNPDMSDARLERASIRIKAGEYAQALAEYDEIIRQDPASADAYFGRAVARDRMNGNADSTLADFATAFARDSTRIDALFERGSLNQRLSQNTAAADDFQRFLTLATNPNDREAAQARLAELRPPETAPRPVPVRVSQARIYLHYSDPADSAVVTRIRAGMLAEGVFRVPSPELIRRGSSVGELRYPEGDDRYVKDALVITEGALARAGFRLRLTPRALDPKRFPDATPGRLEVWLPPLSRSLYSVEQTRARLP